MDSKEISKQIPSIYYDLIARVTPGIPLVAVVFWETKSQLEMLKDISGSGVMLVAAGFAASYVLGLLLTSVWHLAALVRKVGAVVIRLRPATGRRGSGSTKGRIDSGSREVGLLREADSKADAIDVAYPQHGATLLKMRAESRLCQNLLAGLLVLWLARATVWKSTWSIVPWYGFALLATLLLWSVISRHLAYQRRVDRLHRLLCVDCMRPEDWSVVRRGTWKFDGRTETEVWICQRLAAKGPGDQDAPPNTPDNERRLGCYVWWGSPGEPGRFAGRVGPFGADEAAQVYVESCHCPSLQWLDEPSRRCLPGPQPGATGNPP